jgi:hypothetical protein
MIYVTQQQRDNALEALNVMWPSVPPRSVDLGKWRDEDSPRLRNKPPTCGSIACFGGWCAWWPSFRAQGVRTSSYGAPKMKGSPEWSGADDASSFLFGDRFLFTARRGGEDGTDHEIVTNRLKKLIANSKVMTTEQEQM